MSERADKQTDEYLIELVASVIEQRESLLKNVSADWNRIYKISDFHHVSNTVYFKIMFSEDPRLSKIKSKFESRYRFSLNLQERYKNFRQEFASELEKAKINCVFLGESLYLPFYSHAEMRMPQPVKVLLESEKLADAANILLKMNFTQDEGENFKFTKFTDVKAEICDSVNFLDKNLNSKFKDLLEFLPAKKGSKYIKYMDLETMYLYTIADFADKYSQGQIEIRDMADLWLLYSKQENILKWKKIDNELIKLNLDKFEDYLIKLASKWFGRMSFPQEADKLESMQEYIISKGENARKENEKILPLVKKVADNYYKDLKKLQKARKRQLMFPGLDYMKKFYPVLEKHPGMLGFFWIIRLVRNTFSSKMRKSEENDQKDENAKKDI